MVSIYGLCNICKQLLFNFSAGRIPSISTQYNTKACWTKSDRSFFCYKYTAFPFSSSTAQHYWCWLHGWIQPHFFSFFLLFNVFLIILLFPRHSGWEFQKHSLLCYLRSHCSPTGLTLLRLISEGFLRLQRQHAETAAECCEKHTLFLPPPPPCSSLVHKHKHRRTHSRGPFSDALYLASLGVILLLVSTEQLCQPKVCDFHVLRSLNKDVPGSKVTVHQATLLQIVHSLQ